MTDYKQIALNPELSNWQHRETKVDHQYKVVVIEEAANWEYVYIPGLEHSQGEHPDHIDYNRIPQSLHYDDGMKITWGWMKWQAGYRQPINVNAGQRYTAVVKFAADIRETSDPNAVQWMVFVDGLESTRSTWSSYSSAVHFGTAAEHQFVFQAATQGWVDLTFWAKSEWTDSAGELRVKSIEVFEVPQDYGQALPVIAFPNDDQHPPGPAPIPNPDPVPEPPIPTPPPWLLWLMLGVCICVILAAFVSIIAPHVQAQEVTPMEGLMPIEEAANLLMMFVAAIGVSGMASPLTEPLVSLVKLILKAVGREKLLSGDGVNLLVSIVIVLVAWGSKHLGVELQTQSVFDWLIDFIPWVISGLTFFVGHKYVYQKAQALKLPMWKYQRSE